MVLHIKQQGACLDLRRRVRTILRDIAGWPIGMSTNKYAERRLVPRDLRLLGFAEFKDVGHEISAYAIGKEDSQRFGP